MDKTTELFEKAPINKAVWKLALPTMISMIVMIVYNLADTYFIGQTGNTNMVAAISLALPLFMLCNAVGNLFGIGGSTTISRNMGEGRKNRVKHVSSFAIWGSIFAGIIFGIFVLIFIDPIIQIIGANKETAQFVKDYLTIIAAGAPFIILSFTFSNIVRAEGASKEAMIGSMIGTITNIILDPIMILLLGMNVKGAAYATVIGNMAACIFYIYYMSCNTQNLSGNLRDFKIKDCIAQDVFKIGIAGSLNNLMMSIVNIFYNNYLLMYGNAAIAAAGIATKGSFIMGMILIGLAMGAQPLVGYSYGANNYDRLKDTLKYTLKVGVIIGTIIAALLAIFANYFTKSFINDTEVIEYGTKMLRILSVTGPILMFNFVSMITLQSMGKTVASLFMSVSRQGILFVPTIIIASKYFGLDGLMWAQPIANIGASLIGVLLLVNVMRNLKTNKKSSKNMNTKILDTSIK
jgi:putative MATE family efflux protein